MKTAAKEFIEEEREMTVLKKAAERYNSKPDKEINL